MTRWRPAAHGGAASGTGAAGAGRAATVRAGLAALGKCALLLVGVPATLVRLWLLASPPGRSWASGVALLTHAVLAAVAAGWVVAGMALVRDLAGALTRRPLDASSWSCRWAIPLAAFLLMVGAGAASATSGRARPAPAAASDAAAAAAPAPPAPRLGTTATVGTLPGSLQPAGPAGDPGGGPGAAATAAIVAAVGLGALVGAALAGRARLLRRAAGALRRPGERQAAPSAASVHLERLLGALGGDALVEWVDGANRLLWRSLRTAPGGAVPGGTVPEVRLVRVGPDGVELLLDPPVPDAAEGFRALEGGRWWCLDPALDLDELRARTADCGRMLPALLPIGEDGTAAYLVNVPPGRRLAIGGDPLRAERTMAGLVLALRCLPWADELAAELVAVEPPIPAERCYHLSVSSREELDALARGPAHDPRRRLAERWSRQPLVVCAEPGGRDETLLEACRARAGVVSLGGHGDHELVLDTEGAWLEPEGLRIVALCPTPAQLAEADRLLAEAAAPARPSAGADPPAHHHAPAGSAPATPATTPPAAPAVAAPGRVEVRLLDGPPRLEGADPDAVAPRDLPRVVEVVAYLALHGGEAAEAELVEALFLPPVPPDARERLERLVGAARAGLGRTDDGAGLLRRPAPGRLGLDPAVTCDARRLAEAAAAARAAAPEAAERLLRDGLALVGPRPCCPPPGYPWLTASGLREELVATVVDAAHHLGLLALARSDTVLARWAVDQGRRAEPCAEVLARDLLLACDADGDTAGATATWQALEKALAGLGGQEPSEDTRELYASLLRRSR